MSFSRRFILFNRFNCKNYASSMIYRNKTFTINSKNWDGHRKSGVELIYKKTYSNIAGKIVTFEEMTKIHTNSDILVIDVREPSEIKETGQIPNSINIPAGSVADAFSSISEDVFKKTYNISKPSLSKKIIFYCKVGGRSHIAMEQAIKLGFQNAHNYKGSWAEWANNMNAKK